MSSIFLFDTPLGTSGIAWSGRRVVAFGLPFADADLVASRLVAHTGGTLVSRPPPWVAAVTERARRHFGGELDSFSEVPLDLSGLTPFQHALAAKARRVPPGAMITYGELAARSGRPGAARAVGQAMARNPLPLLVPCHRVIGATGSLTGFSSPGELEAKLRLLTIEGADLSRIAKGGVPFLKKADPDLAELIRRVGPFRLQWLQRPDHFAALAESIVHQQVSMAAGRTIYRRLLDQVGSGGRFLPDMVLERTDEDLRAAGLSRQKASYIRDLARRTAKGILPLDELTRMDDERIISVLTEVRGIGRWSAEMYLIFRLGRLNVLPVDDLGVRKGVQHTYRLDSRPSPADVREIGSRWSPYRSIGAWYMWRAAETGGL